MDDPALPPKKTTKLQPGVRRSSRTAEKTGSADGAANDVEHNDVLNEKSPAAGDTEEAAVMGEKPPINDLRPRMSRKESSHDRVTPVPALGSIAHSPNQSPLTVEQPQTTAQAPVPSTERSAYDQVTNPQLNVQAPTPVEPTPASQNQEWTPSEEKRDSDVVMTDAPLDVAEEEHEEVAEPAQPELPAAQVDLPPPPPLGKRESQPASKDVPPIPAASSEKQTWLLPAVQPRLAGRKCLVLDLDETLVHSSFKILNQADFTIPVEIEGQYHNVYVIKRPGVDAFMKRVGELYEVVVFTASVSKYGDPLLDQLDIHHVVHHRLFRESCYNHQGNYVKVGHI